LNASKTSIGGWHLLNASKASIGGWHLLNASKASIGGWHLLNASKTSIGGWHLLNASKASIGGWHLLNASKASIGGWHLLNASSIKHIHHLAMVATASVLIRWFAPLECLGDTRPDISYRHTAASDCVLGKSLARCEKRTSDSGREVCGENVEKEESTR